MESMVTQTLDFMRDATTTEPAQPLNVMALLESLQHDYHDAGQGFEIRGGVTRPVSGRPRVLDDGPGMPEAELERAFEPFVRGESSRSRETGGTGLGLGIARNIARAHGGDVTLANRPGGGLEATLTLPRAEGGAASFRISSV